MTAAGPRSRSQGSPLLQDHRAVLRIAIVLWAAAGSLFVLVAVPASRDVVQAVDDAAHDLAVAAEWDPWVLLAKVLDFLGSTWVTAPLRMVVAVWLAVRRRFEALAVWLLAIVFSEPAIWILKSAYGRERPPDSLVETTGYSFPSGHAIAGAVIVLSLVIVLVPPGASRRNLEVLAATIAFLMGLSRVYLRAHWLSDAAAGVAFGAAVTLLVAAVVHEVADRLDERASLSEGRTPP